MIKRSPALPPKARTQHTTWSKSTIHEALLDLWMEFNGIETAEEMTEAQWKQYVENVEFRSSASRLRWTHYKE